MCKKGDVMKKLIVTLIMFVSCIVIAGCENLGSTIESVSKNLSTYIMDIKFNDETKTLNVEQTLNYVNNNEVEMEELYFHLYPKAFNLDAVNKPVGILTEAKAYYNGESEGDIVIDTVETERDVESMTYINQDEDFLKIVLKDDIDPDEKMEIKFSYTVTLPNCNHRFGYGENTINVANFYPILAVYENGEYSLNPYNSNGDPFFSEIANYEVTITAPEKYVIASTGEESKSSTTDGVTTTTYKAKAVRDYAFVMSEKFEVVSSTIEGVEVMYFYYDDENFEKSLQASIDSLVTFNELFGEYPYSTLSVVKCNFVHGGMEYPNLVYISDDVEAEADYINVIVHEIAHQWWYGLVGNDAFVNSWLDEGLTEFSTNLFYEHNPSYNVDTTEIIKNITKSYITFVDVYSSILGEVDTSMNRRLNEFDTEPEYVYITYVKGNLFFNSLRELVGEDKFIKALQKYVETYKFGISTPECLLGVFEEVTNTDLSQFFASWIEGKVDIVEM